MTSILKKKTTITKGKIEFWNSTMHQKFKSNLDTSISKCRKNYEPELSWARTWTVLLGTDSSEQPDQHSHRHQWKRSCYPSWDYWTGQSCLGQCRRAKNRPTKTSTKKKMTTKSRMTARDSYQTVGFICPYVPVRSPPSSCRWRGFPQIMFSDQNAQTEGV